MITREEAAELRRLKLRAPADRPTQRMSERGADVSRGCTPAVRAQITLNRAPADQESSTTRAFEGFASVTGQTYQMYDFFGPYDELVVVGAFATTLAADPDVPLVLDHVSSRRIARTGNSASPPPACWSRHPPSSCPTRTRPTSCPSWTCT
jgi:hypothetical protein